MLVAPPRIITAKEQEERARFSAVYLAVEEYLTPLYKSFKGFSRRKLLKFVYHNWGTEIAGYTKPGGIDAKAFIENNKLKIKMLTPDFEDMI